MASRTPSRASAPFDLETVRETPGLLAEFERLVARWSVAPPVESPFVWPEAVDAPPELKAFYAIAHTWPGARLFGSQDFLRPLDHLARDGGKLTIITENQGNFRIALEAIKDAKADASKDAWMLWACTFGQTRPWMPMDGARLPDLLVTFGIQELMFGARFLTANNRHFIEDCHVGGGFVPLWRGSYVDDAEWTFLWHPEGAIAGRIEGETWYWCGQTRQGRLWEYLGEPEPNVSAMPLAGRASTT